MFPSPTVVQAKCLYITNRSREADPVKGRAVRARMGGLRPDMVDPRGDAIEPE
jgi:hypothetical protein